MAQNIYNGRDNPFQIVLKRPDTYALFTSEQMADITRAVLIYNPTGITGNQEVIDSQIYSSMFDWVTYAASSILQINIKMMSMTPGRDENAIIIIYTTEPGWTDGVVCSENQDIQVSDAAKSGGNQPPIYALPAPIIKQVNYSITLSDLLSGSAFEMNSVLPQTFLIPAMSQVYDGIEANFLNINTGNMVLSSVDATAHLGNLNTISLIIIDQFSSMKLKYIFTTNSWAIIASTGTYTGA